MRRRWWALLLVTAMLIMMAPAAALADDGLPPTPLNIDPANKPLYEQYSLWSYTVDTQVSDGAIRQLAHLLNGLNLTRAWLVKLAIRAAEYALTWRLPETFAELGAKVTEALRVLLWEGAFSPLVTAALTASGLVLLWLAGRGRARMAWEHLLRLTAVLLLGALVTGTAGPSLKSLSALTGEMSTALLTEPARVMAPAQAGTGAEQVRKWAVTATGEAAWRSFVLYPWAVQEFGGLEAAKRYSKNEIPGATLLEMAPARRLDWYWTQPMGVRERDLSWWTEEAIPKRMTLAGVTTVGATVFAAGTLLLAGSVIIQQLLFVLLVMASPVVFVLALWPGLGRHWLARWTSGLVRALIGQVLAASLLGLFMMLVLAVGGIEAETSWELSALLLVALAGGVLAARRLLRVRRREGAPTPKPAPAPAAGATRVERTTTTVQTVAGGADSAVPVVQPLAGPAPDRPGPDPGVSEVARELAANRTRALLAGQTEPAVHRPAGLPLQAGPAPSRPAGPAPAGAPPLVVQIGRQ
jgi:hypothetical protein